MPPLRFQIVSDLHLETPLQSPSYTSFTLPIHAPNLLLLGDVGLAKHPQLFLFLSTLLSTHPSLTIFYVLGNHEAYGTTMEVALQSFSDFESSVEKKYAEKRFYFMNRRRVDIDERVTVLGCTLWTHISTSSALSCATLLTDFNDKNGIWDRSVDEHNADHARDTTWLNNTVAQITADEPQRHIVIITHHNPTTDPRANDPRHANSSVDVGFRTDLSSEVCWTAVQVRMWAFGHTHYNCQFWDDGGEGGRRMLVLANQKGYAKPGGGIGTSEGVVIENGEEGWRVVMEGGGE